MLRAMTRVPHGFWLANLAVVWAALFTAWALFGSAYSSGETILEENPERLVLIAVAAPLVLASAVWVLLHVASRFDAIWARRAASVLAWLLVAFAVITGFSIGLFVLPAAIALVAAAALTPVT
jgi:hypothetical protein